MREVAGDGERTNVEQASNETYGRVCGRAKCDRVNYRAAKWHMEAYPARCKCGDNDSAESSDSDSLEEGTLAFAGPIAKDMCRASSMRRVQG